MTERDSRGSQLRELDVRTLGARLIPHRSLGPKVLVELSLTCS